MLYEFEIEALISFIAGLVVGGGGVSLAGWAWFLRKVRRLEVL